MDSKFERQPNTIAIFFVFLFLFVLPSPEKLAIYTGEAVALTDKTHLFPHLSMTYLDLS